MATVTALFPLGRIVATPGALDAFRAADESPAPYIRRHAQGDWGDLDAEDRQANVAAVFDEARILSAYRLADSTKVWVITEADRASTCILLPEEY